METKILQHTINYSWFDGKERELDSIDIEHIKTCIENDYSQGELYQIDPVTLKDFRGWWQIIFHLSPN